MKKRIFHKVLIPALVVMLMTPFCVTVVKADATNQQILDMLTSIRSQIVYILQTQRVGSTGNYDTVDYLQKMDTNLLELDTHLTEIMADMTAAWDQTDPIQTDNYFESILNYFKAFYDGIGSSSTHLYYIRGNTASMVTALNNISSDLDHISAKIDELVTLVSNIDNTLDTISWNNADAPSTTYFSKDGIEYSLYESGNITFSTGDIYLKIPSIAYRYNYLYKLTIPFYYYNNDDNDGYKLEVIENIGSTTNNVVNYWTTNSITQINVYFIVNSSVNANNIYLHLSTSNKKGQINPRGEYSLKYLNTEDIEYWQLLSYFKTYDLFKILDNGDDQSNYVINNNNQLNDQFNQSINQYDQIENQFKESFSTNMNQINKPDLSNIVSAAAWYTTQLTSLFNASGSFQIIYVLPLVLGIALFFIGRGAVAFRQSSNQETRWVETVKDENGFTTRHGTIRSETVRGKGRYK